MKLPATAAAALSLALAGHSQSSPQFTDPANLRGERVQPKTGRELPIDQAASGLQQLLRKLNTRASLMLIVAHPDDEDGGMLTFYSRGQGARVADLSLTRGEGGQNAMTGDFEDALGLIRTQELLAADRYFGADQFFGTEVDFGFSKTKEEAFRKWTHERVLYDAVRAVRLYRPLVIAAVFIGGVTDGHGQHQVSGQIAQEVFKAAADPTVFPELTREGILPWAPLKVYARVPSFAIQPQGLFDYATNQYVPPTFTNYVTGETTTTPPTPDVVIHEGQPDPLLTNGAANPADLREKTPDPNTRLSYVQFARIGLGLQRTQIGPGVRLAAPGVFDVTYHLYGSRVHSQAPQESGFFDGIDISIQGIATLIPNAPNYLTDQLRILAKSIDEAKKAFTTAHPEACAKPLSNALEVLDPLLTALEPINLPVEQKQSLLHELRVKRVQLNDALVLALGLSVETRLDTTNPHECASAIYPSCTARVETFVQNGATAPVQIVSDYTSSTGTSAHERTRGNVTLAKQERLRPEGSFFEQGWTSTSFAMNPPGKATEQARTLAAAEGRPFFSRVSIEQPFYDLNDPALRLAPATPPDSFWTRFRFGNLDLLAGHIIATAASSKDHGSPLFLAPDLSLEVPAHAAVIPKTNSTVNVGLQARMASTTSGKDGEVFAEIPVHWTTSPRVAELPRTHANDVAMLTFAITPTPGNTSIQAVHFAAESSRGRITEGYRTVGYPGLVSTPLYSKAEVQIVPVDLNLPTRRRIAYLPGTGDAVADNLRSVGFEVSNLTVSELTPENLAHFDTVLLGVRAYNAHPDLHGAPTQALLDFARSGGNVVVQYQTGEFTAADAPYPLTLGNAEKVVDETAPVRLLESNNPALNTPNRITPADFDGWIEERGHGFLGTWDARYKPLTETHDPGAPAEHIVPQLPQEGGLITTTLGRGHWTYVAFALYRQLPEAVPGAFRLFTNLLGLADEAPR